MTTYSISLNERSAQGQALIAYLSALNVKLTKLTGKKARKTSMEKSLEDMEHGRVEKFDNADDMCKALGIE